MPTLDWIGKKAVVNHHRQVPYHLLGCDASLSAGDPDCGNLLVQGDNLLALKALLPYYAGKVKCIYIDPPYNTGNEKWVYNDAVNSPEMRNWLGNVVGAEAEDLSRHDKWLCMMMPRLKVLRDLLRDDGFVFVSIDDNEFHHLRALMDEVFGETNWVATFIWKKKGTSTNVRGAEVSSLTDYVVAYRKTSLARLVPRITPRETRIYPNEDAEGSFRTTIIEKKHAGSYARESMRFKILERDPRPGKRWQLGQKKAKELEARGRFILEDGIVKLKIYDFEDTDSSSANPTLLEDCGTSDSAARQVNQGILGEPELFDNPKPVELVERLLSLSGVTEEDIILDSFAGSGTTGHAVLAINKADGGNRRFILVEMDENVCRNVTAQRLSRVIDGYEREKGGEKELVQGLGGGFRYCTLGDALFDEAGNIRECVTFPELAAHIFFTETGAPIPKQATGRSPMLGVHEGKAVYLLFNGVLGDKRANGGNVLTGEVLRKLPNHNGIKVIYGEGCRLGAARLKREGIVFKQIPYHIRVS